MEIPKIYVILIGPLQNGYFFHIPKRHRSAFLQQRYSIGISHILHPVGKVVCEVFSAVRFGIVPQRRGGSFRTKELFVLCGKAQQQVKKMPKFMERRAGLRDVDGFLAVVGGSNAAHVQFLAEAAHVVEVDAICPAGGVEGGKHRLRHLPQCQQVVIDVDACRVYQRYRRVWSLHGESSGQNGVKEHSSVPAGDDLVCIILLAAELKLLPDADAVFMIGQRHAARIECAVINGDLGCGKGAFVESTAAELGIGRGECGFIQPALPVGLFHSILAQFAPRASVGFHAVGTAEHDSPLAGRNRCIFPVPCVISCSARYITLS